MSISNEMPRIAQIGCGRWGRNIARALSKHGALQVVIDPAAHLISDYVEGLGARVTEDLAEALSPDIDGVAIAAPAVDHFRLASMALEAGKAVFVEKPLALELEEAEQLAALAASKNLPLMVGHLLQYHPAFLRLKAIVAEGEIGEVRHISSNRLNPGAIRTEETALWSMAPHDFSMILSLTGMDPVSVDASAVRVVNPAIPDQYSVQMRFTPQLTALVNVSWISPFKEHKLVVLGTKGAVVFEDTAVERDRKLMIYRDYVDSSGAAPAFVKGPGEPIDWPADEPLFAEMAAFINAISNGASSPTGPEEAIPVLKLLCRATASAELA